MSRRNKQRQTPAVTPAENVRVTDEFSNPLFRLGFGSQSPLEATEYPLTRMTENYALLNSLYRTNWIVQNVVSIVPEDMTREWYTIAGADITPEMQAAYDRAERVTQLKAKVTDGLRWGRLYGGAVGLILIRGQESIMDQPLDLESILPGSFAGLMILDRWVGVVPGSETVADIGDPDFGLPAYYLINDPGTHQFSLRVHHSRVVRFTGRDLPYIERVACMYWGESEIEALYADVVKHDNVSANMAALTFRANVDTMEMENLDQILSIGNEQAKRRFWTTMQAQSVMRSNFGLQLVNKGDQITNHQYTFTGLQEVYESMCLNLAGSSRIPMTKLFGRSATGLNATGEGDQRNYNDYLDSQRESKLRPVLERLLPVMAMSTWGAVPEGIEVTFPPLWTPTAKEVAEIAKAKTEAVISAYTAGLLNVDTAQRELKSMSEETGLYTTLSDAEIAANEGKTYQDATALRDPLMGLGFGKEDPAPFEGAAQDAAVQDYNPSQPRDRNGRWTSGGGSGTIKGTKYAPSPQRTTGGIQLSPRTYARLTGALNTRFPGLQEGEIRKIRDNSREYTVKADGFGGFKALMVIKIK